MDSRPQVQHLLDTLSWLGTITLSRLSELGTDSTLVTASVYGSCRSGFYDPKSSDVDVVIRCPGPWDSWNSEKQTAFSKKFLQKLESVIHGHFTPEKAEQVVVNKWARIPVLYLYDVLKGNGHGGFKEVNVVFGFDAGLFNSEFLHAYANLDQQMFHVGQAVKSWAKQFDLVSSEKNSFCCISSYAWVLMVIFYFQVRKDLPCLQTVLSDQNELQGLVGRIGDKFYGQDEVRDTRYVDPKGWLKSIILNRETIDELLEGFFVFYSRVFDPETMTVDVRNPSRGMRERSYFDSSNGGRLFSIADPFEDRNLVKGLTEKGWSKIKRAIGQAAGI